MNLWHEVYDEFCARPIEFIGGVFVAILCVAAAPIALIVIGLALGGK